MPFQSKKIKGICDIVFCVDATGSMTPCIDALKDQIRSFIQGLEKPADANTPPLNWRMRVIGFRDLNEGEAMVNLDAPMVKTGVEAQAQVDLLEAQGGGDEPESALDAVWLAAAQTPWRPTPEDPSPARKVIVLFSDATSLPTLHPSTVSQGAVGNDFNAVRQILAEKNVAVYAWAPACPTWKELSQNNKLVTYQEIADAGTGLSTINFANLLKDLGKTLSQSAAALQGAGHTQPMR